MPAGLSASRSSETCKTLAGVVGASPASLLAQLPGRDNCSRPPRSKRLVATPFTPLREDRSGLPGCHGLDPHCAVSLLSDECPAGRSDAGTTPSADFCRAVRTPRGFLSREFPTHGRPPEVSLTVFPTHLPDLPLSPLMDMGFVVLCQLARTARPPIRFLYVRSRFCSTLLSDPASRRRPCASLTLHLHQVG